MRELGWDNMFLQAIVVSLAWFFDGQQIFISAFTDTQPSWRCKSSSSSSCNHSSSSIDSSFCNLQKDAWAWDFPTYTSIISEWSLQCDGSIITGLPASSFFMGCVIGGFLLSTLADSFLGRKNMLVLSCLLMSVTGLISSFSNNVWVYSFFRFLSGFGRATLGTCALVLSTELVMTSKWQGQVGISGLIFCTLGFLSLPIMAFLNRGSSWRLLYLWTCLPAILYSFLVCFIVRESPRWLYVKGNKGEMKSALLDVAYMSELETNEVSNTTTETINLYSAIKMLVDKNWALRRLITMMWVGFGLGVVYYGIPLAVGNLALDLYLSNALNALAELPASLMTCSLIGQLRRKVSLLGFAMLSGICIISCAFIDGENFNFKLLQLGVELLSFFSVRAAFDVMLIYSLELFPTCVRNSAVAMVRQTSMLGGIISPLVVATSRNYNRWFTYLVFGLSAVTCGFFVVFLPETQGSTLCDTMEEEENKSNGVTFVC